MALMSVFIADRLTTPMVAINNTSRESQDCYHDDDAFKYHAYIVTYLLIFPVAFLFNVGALMFLSQRRRRRWEHKHESESPQWAKCMWTIECCTQTEKY